MLSPESMVKQCLYDVSVVIPVYLGETTVETLSGKLVDHLQHIAPNYEIILINDASPDASWEKIERICQNNKRIKGIDLIRNSGQHSAISAGLKYAFGEKIVVMDCDMQDDPDDLPKLLAKSDEGYDIVLARRARRDEHLFKRMLSWSFHQALSLKRGRKTDPAIANYAVYRGKVIYEFYRSNPDKLFSIFNLDRGFSRAVVDTFQGASIRGRSGYSFPKLLKLAASLLFPGKRGERKSSYVIRETKNVEVENYGVRLVPLSFEKTETVRQWRNSPQIAKYMEFREYITPEMQQKWFESINNERNHYFIIEYEGREIGLINAKNIDYTGKTSEGGLFIYDDDYLESDVPFRASLCMIGFTENILKMERGTVRILRNNKRAIQFNKALGYLLQPGQERLENQLYSLEKENFNRQKEYITKILSL